MTVRAFILYVLAGVGVVHLLVGGVMLYRLHQAANAGGQMERAATAPERWIKMDDEPICASRR